MKAGYTVVNTSIRGDKLIEVINYERTNKVVNMGWIFTETPYKLKDSNTVGIWKLKHFKN